MKRGSSPIPRRADAGGGGIVACLVAAVLGLLLHGAEASAQASPFKASRLQTDEGPLAWRHRNGGIEALAFPSPLGGGLALLDADGDGRLDIYLVNSGTLDSDGRRRSVGAVDHDLLLVAERSDPATGGLLWRPQVVESSVGPGYGMGVAVGDADNDGDVDLFRTALGGNVLLLNEAGSFVAAPWQPEVRKGEWSTASSWLDFDRDGWLDLWVVNYVDFDPGRRQPICYDARGSRDFCSPESFQPLPDRLYRNLGDGRFEDVSRQHRLHESAAPGLGSVVFDADDDGWLDIFVANDHRPNQLWINEEGAFREVALALGVALSLDGRAEAGMGVVAEDLDLDGDADLFLTHLTGETNTLYRNQGGVFVDETRLAEVGTPSLRSTGFGVAAADFDRDGAVDLAIGNGSVRLVDARGGGTGCDGLAQPNLYCAGQADGGFSCGPLQELECGATRGLARGDLDNDGDLDLVALDNGGSPLLYWNPGAPGHEEWFGIDLREARRGGSAALGATLRFTEGARQRSALVRTDGSYLSSGDSRVVFVVEGCTGNRSVTVAWLGGESEQIEAQCGRYHLVERSTELLGKSRVIPMDPAESPALGETPAVFPAGSERGRQPESSEDTHAKADRLLVCCQAGESAVVSQVREAQQRVVTALSSGSESDAWFDLGKTLMVYGYLNESAMAFERVEGADRARAKYLSSLSHIELGELETALQKLLELRGLPIGTGAPPDLVSLRMAQALLESGSPVEAGQLAESLLSSEYATAARQLLAEVAVLQGLDEEALRHLEVAERLHPTRRLHTQRLAILGRLGRSPAERADSRLDRAVEIKDPLLEEVLSLDRSRPGLLDRFQRALAGGDWRSAASFVERVLERSPEDAALWINLGVAQMAGGEETLALDSFRRATQLDAANAVGWFNRGSVEARTRLPSAEASLRQALKLDPEMQDARWNLANLLLRRLDYCGAARQYGDFVRASPGDQKAVVIWLQALVWCGETRAAVEAARLLADEGSWSGDRVVLDSVARVLTLSEGPSRSEDLKIADRLLFEVAETSRSLRVIESVALLRAAQGRFDKAIELQALVLGRLEEGIDEALERRARARLGLFREHRADPAVFGAPTAVD